MRIYPNLIKILNLDIIRHKYNDKYELEVF
jgi:hypothetical protein